MTLVTKARDKLSWCEKDAVLVLKRNVKPALSSVLHDILVAEGLDVQMWGFSCANKGTCHLFFAQAF